jgi:hypothetical protein
VITSGNTAVAQRNRENGWAADITGHADFLDPIDHVQDVARHPPNKVIVLTDPQDARVSVTVQTAYVEALRAAGVPVDHRFLPAAGGPGRLYLFDDALRRGAASRMACEPAGCIRQMRARRCVV